MTEQENKEIQQMNVSIKTLAESVAQIKERILTKSDRKFLYELITKILRPSLANATTGNGAVVLAAGVSGTVLEDNEIRFSATVVNAGANDAFLSFWQGAALITTGLLLRANGGAVTFGNGTDIPYNGRVTGISTAGTTLDFVEFNKPNIDIEF